MHYWKNSVDMRVGLATRVFYRCRSEQSGLTVSAVNLKSYISGYVDGEGCFCVSFHPSVRHRFGWEVRPSFSVSQNFDRSQVLYLIQKVWNCGFIRPDRSDKTLKYEVRSMHALVTTVVPHFREFPLMSAKQSDFERFAGVCEAVREGKHLVREGFEQIIRLSMEMNPSGKRKYTSREIINSLPRGLRDNQRVM